MFGKEKTLRQRGSAPLIMALVMVVAGTMAFVTISRKVAFNSRTAIYLSVRQLVQQTTRASIETIDQMLYANDGVNDEPGNPYFTIDMDAGTLTVNGTLPPYIDLKFDNTSTPTFTFEHCDVRNGDFRLTKYGMGTEYDETSPCPYKINTTIKIKEIAPEGIVVAAESTSNRPIMSQYRYRIGARFVRIGCDFMDPADKTKLHPDLVMEFPGVLNCHGKPVSIHTARYRDTATYDSATDTMKFNFWTHHRENVHNYCSTYRWDMLYNAYYQTKGDPNKHPTSGVDFTGPNQYFKNTAGFVKGYWIWDGGWSLNHTVTVTDVTTGTCTLAVQTKWGNPTGSRNGGCFTPNTQILLTNGKTMAVEDLNIGYQVYNPVTQKPVTVRRIVAGPELNPLYKVTVAGHSVQVTETHPFLTVNGLRQAQELKNGDLIFCEKTYCEAKVEQIAPEPGQMVYNLVVDGGSSNLFDHFVVADGVVSGDLYLQGQLQYERLNKPVEGGAKVSKAAPPAHNIEYTEDEWEYTAR